MSWLYVFFAGVVEIFWVIGLRYSSTAWHWIGTAVLIFFSFHFIIKACEQLPSGTVYAVFTGMGASGIVILDFLMFGAEFSVAKLLLLSLIITGVIGIKLTSSVEKNVEGEVK